MNRGLGDSSNNAGITTVDNIHKGFAQGTKVSENYEKQVKVRGHLRPLTNHTGRQSRPGFNGFSDFG